MCTCSKTETKLLIFEIDEIRVVQAEKIKQIKIGHQEAMFGLNKTTKPRFWLL